MRILILTFVTITTLNLITPAPVILIPVAVAQSTDQGQEQTQPSVEATTGIEEESFSTDTSVLSRALSSGFVVFLVLAILVTMSAVTWAIVVAKWLSLRKTFEDADTFIRKFWDSKSLNELNNKLSEYPNSPVKEMFRCGYGELVRGSQLRENAGSLEIAITAAMDNLNRSLHKSKMLEKRKLEKFMPFLAICASAAPFIGLFGTVWGIMNAFEGIAQTGSASLAAVAPGISEALIATAFGLAAAIPAVVGYNIFNTKIREYSTKLDGFLADFLNIVERYLAIDHKSKNHSGTASSPLPEKI